MSKHLIKYTTQEEYEEFIDNSILERPNCVLIENDKKIHYNSKFPIKLYSEPNLVAHDDGIYCLEFDFTPEINLYEIYIDRVIYGVDSPVEYSVPDKIFKHKGFCLNDCKADSVFYHSFETDDIPYFDAILDVEAYKLPDGYTLSPARDFSITIEKNGHITGFIGLVKDLISFTVDNKTFNAVEGMTWGEWLDSEYNTDGFYRAATDHETIGTGWGTGHQELCLYYPYDEIIPANATYTTRSWCSPI